MKGQNIEKKEHVDKKNSINCVKLIRKQEIISCFFARQNVPRKPRKLIMWNWVNYQLRRTKGKQIKQGFYSCTITANIKKTNGKLKRKTHVKINQKTRNQKIYSPRDENIWDITAVRKKDKSWKSKWPQKRAQYFEINRISTVLN